VPVSHRTLNSFRLAVQPSRHLDPASRPARNRRRAPRPSSPLFFAARPVQVFEDFPELYGPVMLVLSGELGLIIPGR